MWSGTTFRKDSGRIMGVHQRVDRIARRRLSFFLDDEKQFPAIRLLLRFEGIDGPDGLKRKSPGVDEPWHFFDPHSQGKSSQAFLLLVRNHLTNLSTALRENNEVRAAFEAAWLAHAVTDGLTPAHQYPFEEKLQELRNGEHHSTRTSRKQKMFMPGKNVKDFLKNNWKWWGAKGVMTSHVGFELGIATAILGKKMHDATPDAYEIEALRERGFEAIFIESAQRIADLEMYHTFIEKGWTHNLAQQTRRTLVPEITRIVVLAWISALYQSGVKK